MAFSPADRSPTLRKLLKTRLAPIRENELISKALCADRPEKPAPGACCGSSCDPCVLQSYAEELRVWRECWEKWEGGGKPGAGEKKMEEGKGEGEGRSSEGGRKIPGAFEW